jgi:hypothetical protein
MSRFGNYLGERDRAWFAAALARRSNTDLRLAAQVSGAPQRAKVDEMRSKRDIDGAEAWLRIIVAIGTLGTPPTDVRH